jgi:hypothetical protein
MRFSLLLVASCSFQYIQKCTYYFFSVIFVYHPPYMRGNRGCLVFRADFNTWSIGLTNGSILGNPLFISVRELPPLQGPYIAATVTHIKNPLFVPLTLSELELLICFSYHSAHLTHHQSHF